MFTGYFDGISNVTFIITVFLSKPLELHISLIARNPKAMLLTHHSFKH